MKPSIVRIASAVCVIALLMGYFSLCLPPACAPIYIGAGVCAIVPLCFGSWRYRIFGCLALFIAVALTVREYREGKVLEQRRQHLLEQLHLQK